MKETTNKRSRGPVLLAAAIFALAGMATGCVTGSEPSSEPTSTREGDVVERSKEQPPAWIELEAGRLLEGETELKFVAVHKGLLDLPFGLKTAQLAAMQSSESALRQSVQVRLTDLAKEEGIPMTAPAADLERLLAETTKELHGERAKVADIYFETVRIERGGSQVDLYDVFVIVQLPRVAATELVNRLSTRLSASRDPNLRRLGLALSRTTGTPLSH